MKTPIKSLLVFALALASAASVFASASQDAIIADIKLTRNETILTHNELAANLQSLLTLTNQREGDLRPTFVAFQAGLPKTTVARERTFERAAKLVADGKQHFAAWQADIDTINDKEIKRHAFARLESTTKRWNDVVSALQDSVNQFGPLQGYLHDIDIALSYDLTAKGVRSVRGAADSATASFQRIQSNVTHAVEEMDAMAKELGSVLEK